MTKANKVTTYCIKDGIDKADIIKEKVKSCELYGGTLFYKDKPTVSPTWVKNFFCDYDKIRNLFKVASSQAVYIKSIKIDGQEKFFAMGFGAGHHLLDKSTIVPNFGLKTVLNIIDEKNIKKVDTHNISSVPKHKSEQITKPGELQDFSLNIETDILMGITGEIHKSDTPKLYDMFGGNITGKDSIAASVRFDAQSIDEFLKKLYEYSISGKYKEKGFGWIDNIKRISKKDAIIPRLNAELDVQLKYYDDLDDKIWIAVPEIIQWEEIKGFKYKKINNDKEVQNISLSDLGQDLSMEVLQKIRVQAVDANGEKKYEWSALQCLYAEIDVDAHTYMYINSNWYEIDTDFETYINESYKKILNKDVPQIPWIETEVHFERDYNKALAKKIPNAICMDANNVFIGSGGSQVEFCDVFDVKNSNIIHVKNYAGSAVLSHLFNQGYVSATLLRNDEKFREAVTKKIRETVKDFKFGDKDCNIIFAILQKKSKRNSDCLPFFSKVTLNNIVSLIDNIKGFNAFVKIVRLET